MFEVGKEVLYMLPDPHCPENSKLLNSSCKVTKKAPTANKIILRIHRGENSGFAHEVVYIVNFRLSSTANILYMKKKLNIYNK